MTEAIGKARLRFGGLFPLRAIFDQHAPVMPDEDTARLALRTADQLRTDIANLECGQEFLMQLISQVPTRADLARATLGGKFCTAVLVLLGIAVFWPHGLWGLI